ncbi:MAG TPA: hypothetical protein VE057_05940 [Archangium sp.]|nr:hypothetical protein [Archangium sp.]
MFPGMLEVRHGPCRTPGLRASPDGLLLLLLALRVAEAVRKRRARASAPVSAT